MMDVQMAGFTCHFTRCCLDGLCGAAIVVTAALSGCGGPGADLYPVSGKVVYFDGSPLPANSTVNFLVPPGSPYRIQGEIQADGTFSMHTIDATGEEQPGAPVGSYRVFVLSQGADSEQAVTTVNYADPATSGITIRVEARPLTGIEIAVARPGSSERNEGL